MQRLRIMLQVHRGKGLGVPARGGGPFPDSSSSTTLFEILCNSRRDHFQFEGNLISLLLRSEVRRHRTRRDVYELLDRVRYLGRSILGLVVAHGSELGVWWVRLPSIVILLYVSRGVASKIGLTVGLQDCNCLRE